MYLSKHVIDMLLYFFTCHRNSFRRNFTGVNAWKKII